MCMLAAFVVPLALVGSAVRPHTVASRPALAGVERASRIEMYWHIFPRDYSDSSWHENTRSSAGTLLTKEYNLEPGKHQALGCYDINGQSVAAPDQCVVQVADDGSCVFAYAQGTTPTGWRTRPDEPWNWMQPGQQVALQNGWKISLDCNNPEAAVYKFEKAGRFLVQEYLDSQNSGQVVPPTWQGAVDQQQGGFGQQQGGFGGQQQGGYGGQQGGYGQQQGGYGGQQGGYGGQQGGYGRY